MIARNDQPDPTRSFQHRLLRDGSSPRTNAPACEDVATPAPMQTAPHWRIRSILVPTDFSPSSVNSVRQAAALARRYDALLTILHVIDCNPPSARTHLGPADELMKQLRANGRAELRRLTDSLAQQQTRTQARIIEGLPADVILELSASFDLLVINDERSKPAWNLFSKHTARRVIEAAACPLLVLHPRTELDHA